jgi:ribose 5-phosphate isomerase B
VIRHKEMVFAVASDHAGFRVKELAKGILVGQGINVKDCGTHSEESVDYPDVGRDAVEAVVSGEATYGLLVCGSGVGMSIVANKFPGIRAALVGDEFTAEKARRHNDANVLVLPGWRMKEEDIERIILMWLTTAFEGGRHQRRIDKIRQIEEDIGASSMRTANKPSR